MQKIFVTATNTDVGKTYTMHRLIDIYTEMGYRVGVLKPIETGVATTPPDATALFAHASRCNPQLGDLTIEDICPIRLTLPAAPFVAASGEALDLTPIDEKMKLLRRRCDLLLIEGAGGLMVPIRCSYFMIDLIRDLDAVPLLVTHDRLGSINDTLLSLHRLAAADLPQHWCVNLRDEVAFDRLTRPFYEAYFGSFLTLQHDLRAIAAGLIQ